MIARATFVRELPFGVEGFAHFYWCMSSHELPPYAYYQWTPAVVKAKETQTGVIIEGYRGATKSAFLFWWVLYVLGKRPEGSTILVRINDAAAAETGNAMAEIIENSIGWKLCFPNIVPDKERKWSTEGWYIKDDRVEKSEWTRRTIADHLGEPSLLTAGITSGIHIGKHPSNGWYCDDVHDVNNTESLKEMQNIVRTVEMTIIPTWTRPEGHPTLVVACTFWDEEDAYHSLLKTGLFRHIQTPIYELDDNGEYVYPEIVDNDGVVFRGSDYGKRITLAWPEAFPPERIAQIERRNPVWFPVMYLCRLDTLRGNVLKREWLHSFPPDQLDDSWPVFFGVDFASSDDKLGEKERDYFALAVGRVRPQGGIVLIDGLRGKFRSADSMGHLQAFAVKYPTLNVVAIEKYGKGETFKDLLIYNTDLPILPSPVLGTPTKSKGERFESEGGLAPLAVNGSLWISREKNEFIQAFIDEWVSWDGQVSKTGNDDCLDAVYWMCYAARGHLVTAQSAIANRKKKKKSPWAALLS